MNFIGRYFKEGNVYYRVVQEKDGRILIRTMPMRLPPCNGTLPRCIKEWKEQYKCNNKEGRRHCLWCRDVEAWLKRGRVKEVPKLIGMIKVGE